MASYSLAHLKEATRMLLRSYTSYRKYEGSPGQVCEQIVKNCWNGAYFQTSTGHYTAFYCRDFGMCAPSLLALGYGKEVHQTLSWALTIFAKHNKITTTITENGEPIDCFSYGADSLPFLLHALYISGAKDLVKQYRSFLEKQAIVYIHTVFDKETNLVKQRGEFSSMKDHYVRQSSCYDNCMVGWLLATMKKLRYDSPLAHPIDMRKQILGHFWTGTHFKDDLATDIGSSDAQVFPFYTGLFDAKGKDKKLWQLARAEIENLGLDQPFPLKYTASRDKSKELFLPSLLAPNFEGTTIWIHLGLCYLTILAKLDKKAMKQHLKSYAKNIEIHQNFLEVFKPDGTPYRSLVYQADESMLWAAIYLELSRR